MENWHKKYFNFVLIYSTTILFLSLRSYVMTTTFDIEGGKYSLDLPKRPQFIGATSHFQQYFYKANNIIKSIRDAINFYKISFGDFVMPNFNFQHVVIIFLWSVILFTLKKKYLKYLRLLSYYFSAKEFNFSEFTTIQAPVNYYFLIK